MNRWPSLRVRGVHDRDGHCNAGCVRDWDQRGTLGGVGYGMHAGLWRLRLRQMYRGIQLYFPEGESIR